jgi:hypothetical protein
MQGKSNSLVQGLQDLPIQTPLSSDNDDSNVQTHAFGSRTIVSGTQKSTDWVFDSGAAVHITNDERNLINHQNTPNIVVYQPDGTAVPSIACGTVILDLHNGDTLELQSCYCIPSFSHNLISKGRLSQMYDFHDTDSTTLLLQKNTMKTEKTISHKRKHFIYIFQVTPLNTQQLRAMNVEIVGIWNDRLGHRSSENVNASLEAHDLPASSIQVDKESCEACYLMKSKSKTLPKIAENPATKILKRIHFDLADKLTPTSIEGSSNFLVIVDEYSRMLWIKIIYKKSEVPNIIKNWIESIEKQTGLSVQQIRSDNGTEFVNSNMTEYLTKKGITHQRSCPYHPHQNGILPHTIWPNFCTIRYFSIEYYGNKSFKTSTVYSIHRQEI